jgi:peroxiredoxin
MWAGASSEPQSEPLPVSPLPAVGTPAPDFTLPSTSGTDVTLSKLRERNVLLAFFPLAFTSVCTAEMCSFSEDYGRFRSANTEVLPISVDSVPTLREFKAKERISVDLLSDFKREVSRRYGTLLEDKFFSNRAYILIDPQGLVRWAFAEDTPSTRRENQELLAQLEAHQRSA